jgi:hypothetical protein
LKLNPDTARRLLNPCICGNVNNFDFISRQVCEDCCEVWIQCGECKHDPATGAGEHVETAMGERNNFTAGIAAAVWNSSIKPNAKLSHEAGKKDL